MMFLTALLLSTALGSPVNEHGLFKRQDQGPPITTIPSPANHTGDVSSCQGYRLTVYFETESTLRVRIADEEGKAHVVPNDVAPWPRPGERIVGNDSCALNFEWVEDPFGFKVVRKSDGDVVFDTTDNALIFEEQFVRITSKLAQGSNIQGLGQHNDNFT